MLVFTVTAETFDGARETADVEWSTRRAWSGPLHLSVDQNVPSGTQHMEYEGTIVVADTGHGLEGTIDGEWRQTLSIARCPAETIRPGTLAAKLAGTVDATAMHLTASSPRSVPPYLTPCYGRQPGIMGSPELFDEFTAALAGLTARSDGGYESSKAATHPGGGYPYRVAASIALEPGADAAG
jgi:hypothetical protein